MLARLGLMVSRGLNLGLELCTGNNSTMSGANSWVNSGMGVMNINSTVPGKMYVLGNGFADLVYLAVLTVGKRYQVSLKARINTGAGVTLRCGSITLDDYFSFTPTSVESEFSGSFNCTGNNRFYIGLTTPGFDGVAFEFDDVSIKEIL